MEQSKAQRYATAVIYRDIAEQIAVTVPHHELAILEAVHGPGKVSIHTFTDVVRSEKDEQIMPSMSPEDEYDRLVKKYGNHPDQKVPFVQMAYGVPGDGRFSKALAKDHPPLAEAIKALKGGALDPKEAADLQKQLAVANKAAAEATDEAVDLREKLALAQAELAKHKKE